MDAFAAIRLAVGAGFLAAAATTDLRTRRVSDSIWIVLGSLGLVILATQLVAEGTDPSRWALLGSGALLFYAIFFGDPLFEKDGFHFRPVRIFVFFAALLLFLYPVASFSAAGLPAPQPVLELSSMPAMVVVYQVFYRLRLLHGGADAKGLIALTLLLPTYPSADPFPLLGVDPRVASVLRGAFPFSLVIWIDAAVVFLVVPVGLLVYNAARGDLRLPQAFLGYRARLDPFPAHAWLMEKITDRGDHVLVLFPKRGGNPSADIAPLRARGITRAWVTPQIPFMVPLLIGFLIAFFAGNLLIGILGLARP